MLITGDFCSIVHIKCFKSHFAGQVLGSSLLSESVSGPSTAAIWIRAVTYLLTVQGVSSGADKGLKQGRVVGSHTLRVSYKGALKDSFAVRVTDMLGGGSSHDILCLKHEIMIQDTWLPFLALPVAFCATTGSHWPARRDWSFPVFLSCLPRPWALWNRSHPPECIRPALAQGQLEVCSFWVRQERISPGIVSKACTWLFSLCYD